MNDTFGSNMEFYAIRYDDDVCSIGTFHMHQNVDACALFDLERITHRRIVTVCGGGVFKQSVPSSFGIDKYMPRFDSFENGWS